MIRLIDSRLCTDCDAIFDEELSLACPRCASKQSIHLTRFIKPMEINNSKGKEIY